MARVRWGNIGHVTSDRRPEDEGTAPDAGGAAERPVPRDRAAPDDGLVALDDEPAGDQLGLELPTMRRLLRDEGVDDEVIDRAEAAGVLGFLAIDHFAVAEPARYDLDEAAELTGMSAQQIQLLWRSLGLPLARPGEAIFTEVDVETLSTVAGLMELGLIEADLAVQMSRVIGWSLARVATAIVDSLEGDPVVGAADDPEMAVFAGTMLPTMDQVVQNVWHRHLQIAARRRIVRALDAGGTPDLVAVGFADMVGYTTLSQQIDEHALADVVGRFEEIAYDIVTRRGGRVVKMIGDEVMYVVDDPSVAVRVGLELADEYAADSALSDVRVGIAYGPVVEREADLYGPVVNLASRIVHIAFPGSVVTTREVRDAAGDDPQLAWKSLKPRRIKDIGRVPLYAVHLADERDRTGPRSEVRERRTAAREARLAALEESGSPGRGRSRRSGDP